MKSGQLDHLGINVSDISRSRPFYTKFFSFLGYEKLDDGETWAGWSNGPSGFWIYQTADEYLGNKFHRKATGINHVAFRVNNREEVDNFVENFLRKNNIPSLYGGPKEYPQYSQGYYAVYFEDPDRIKLEVMWTPAD